MPAVPKPGAKCSCGCGCAAPIAKNPKGCPCKCGDCAVCASSPIKVESAPARQPGRTPITEARRPAVPAVPTPMSDAQFNAFLQKITEARVAAAPAAPAVAPTPVDEAAELRGLTTSQLGRRLLNRVAESGALHSPSWRAAVTETAQEPAGLAEQLAAIPAAAQSLTIREAVNAAHHPLSPFWAS